MYQQTSWMLFSIWVLMYCSLCGSDLKVYRNCGWHKLFILRGMCLVSSLAECIGPFPRWKIHYTWSERVAARSKVTVSCLSEFYWLQVVAVQGVSLCQSKLFRLCGTASHVPWRLPRINFKVWENSASSESLERLSNYANMIHDKRFVFTKTF